MTSHLQVPVTSSAHVSWMSLLSDMNQEPVWVTVELQCAQWKLLIEHKSDDFRMEFDLINRTSTSNISSRRWFNCLFTSSTAALKYVIHTDNNGVLLLTVVDSYSLFCRKEHWCSLITTFFCQNWYVGNWQNYVMSQSGALKNLRAGSADSPWQAVRLLFSVKPWEHIHV